MKIRSASTSLVIAALAAIMLAGCSQGKPGAQSDSNAKSDGTHQMAKTVYPITITDDSGTKLTIKQEPQRIVSLLPSNTEIVYALGLGDKLVGVTKWDDYPPEAKQKPVIGDLKPNAEAVLAQKPDLVLGGVSTNGKDLSSLRSLGLTVVAFEPKTIQDVEKTIQEVGSITNTSPKAAEVVSGMEAKLKSITDKIPASTVEKKPRVYVEISPAPDVFTAGQGTFIDEMIKIVGGQNIAGNLQGWVKISSEDVVAQNPQVIISLVGTANDIEKTMASRPGWQGIEAIKNHRVIGVDPNLVSRPGPRIVDGVFQFAKAIYPEKFQ